MKILFCPRSASRIEKQKIESGIGNTYVMIPDYLVLDGIRSYFTFEIDVVSFFYVCWIQRVAEIQRDERWICKHTGIGIRLNTRVPYIVNSLMQIIAILETRLSICEVVMGIK